MADNKIEIVASLNIPESVNTVGKDLKQVAGQINSGKGLKITCNIDLAKTTQRIQSQLATIGKNLKINIPKITYGTDTGIARDSAKKTNQTRIETEKIMSSLNSAGDAEKKRLADMFGVDVNKIVTSFSNNAKGALQNVTLEIAKVSGEVEKFKYKIDETNGSLKKLSSSGTDRGVIQTISKAAKEADNLDIKLRNLHANFTDVNASKPILQTANQNTLAAEYERAMNAVNALRNADASTYQQLAYNAKIAVDNYNNLAKAIRNAETAATDLRSKPIEVIQAEQAQKLEQFFSKIASSGIKDVGNLTDEAERLKAVLNKPLNANEMRTWLNDFAKLNAQFATMNRQAETFSSLKSQINSAVSSLNNQSNTNLFRDNMTDSGVKNQVAAIDELRAKYQSLSAEFQNAKTPQDFIAIQQKLAELSSVFDKVTADTQKLKQVLADNKAMAAFVNNIAKTESSLNKFAATNHRAVNSLKQMSNGQTFQQNWNQMIASLKDPDLNAEKLRQINQQFQIFRNEANAAGLTSSSFFKGMANQIQMVAARWFSLYTVIGKTREMINNVINLDKAMTNLKRVTDETAATYEDFVGVSNKIARDTNTTMIDAVEQSAKWAKAGFNDPAEAAELAKTSLIYSIVGDVDNDTAVNDMVTAIKGFNIEAENAIEIIDKLDILNNNYATDAKSLGEGLTRSASAMAAANNTLDETLAMLTGGTEITQNAAEMGSSLKVISMRIRGMRGELEELGEESEGLESVSKIQTQILNLTKGKVNIFDSNEEFRSTFDILRDISKVIDDLSDPDRANLTEILFGKMRANQGLAILEAFRSGRIDQAMADIIDSEGTALDEIEKYGESITAHITEFKNQWQMLSNDVFDSDFLKTAVDLGTNLITVLDGIVKRSGSLGTAVSAFGALAAFKGVGIFGTIADSANKSNLAVSIFGKSIRGLITDLKSNGLKQGLRNLFGTRTISLINEGDKERVENYFRVLDSTGDKMKAYQTALVGASNATQKIALATNNATEAKEAMAAATTKVTVAERAAVIGTKALGVALNVACNVGATLAISALVRWITNLANSAKRAKEEADELRNSGHDAVENLNNEMESLDNVIQKYVELYTQTNDVKAIKSELSEIQDELNSKYNTEANGIDVVNGKLSEEIEKLRQLKKEQAEAFVYDKKNEKRYKQAVESLKGTGDETDLNYVIRDSYTTLDIDGSKFSDDVHKAWRDAGLKYQEAKLKWSDTFRALHVYGTLEEQKNTLYEMAEIYRKIGDYNEDIYNQMMQKYEVVKQKYDLDKEVVDYYGQQQAYINIDIPDETLSKFYSLIDKARELNQIIQGDGTATEKYTASRDLESLRKELYHLAGTNTELGDIVNATFSEFETGTSKAITSVTDFKDAFYESLNDMQKNSLSNIEKIESAMQAIANGDSIDWETFRALNWDIDVDHILGVFDQVDGGYTKLNGDVSDLIALKDKIINQQIETLRNQISGEAGMTTRIAEIQAEIETLEKKLSHSQSESDAKYYKGLITEKKQDINDINRTIKDNNILIREFKRHLGDTVDHAEEVEKKLEKLNEQLDEAQKKADAYAEAFTTKIDNIVDGLEEQKEVLESQKESMEEQLNVLESQQAALEETIENYEKITDVVNSAVDEETELLREQQKAQEDAYNAKIDALKEAHEQQDEENELTEKQVELQEKLRDLERARNTKVLTYSSARGWHFDVDKDAVAEAEKAVNEAQKSIDDYNAEQAYQSQIKAIEDERDAVIESYDAQIKAYEDYIKQWELILNEEKNAENERLAGEILGSDWREKIKNKDLQILNNYRAGYQNYNAQLSNLVNVEIAALKESIEAKEAEIKVIGDHIAEWNKYKDEVTKAVNEIKNANEEYAQLMAQIPLDENSSYEQRLNALANFKYQFGVYTDEIAYYADQINNIDSSLNIETNIPQVSQEMANFIDTYRDAIYSMQESLADNSTGFGIVNSAWDAKLANAANALRGYSTGGVADYTGLAMLHGTKNNPEIVLNSKQSAELFKMISGNSFADSVAEKAAQGISQLIKTPATNTNKYSNAHITIERMEINGVQNPVDFARQFARNIEEYWNSKTIENYTKR